MVNNTNEDKRPKPENITAKRQAAEMRQKMVAHSSTLLLVGGLFVGNEIYNDQQGQQSEVASWLKEAASWVVPNSIANEYLLDASERKQKEFAETAEGKAWAMTQEELREAVPKALMEAEPAFFAMDHKLAEATEAWANASRARQDAAEQFIELWDKAPAGTTPHMSNEVVEWVEKILQSSKQVRPFGSVIVNADNRDEILSVAGERMTTEGEKIFFGLLGRESTVVNYLPPVEEERYLPLNPENADSDKKTKAFKSGTEHAIVQLQNQIIRDHITTALQNFMAKDFGSIPGKNPAVSNNDSAEAAKDIISVVTENLDGLAATVKATKTKQSTNIADDQGQKEIVIHEAMLGTLDQLSKALNNPVVEMQQDKIDMPAALDIQLNRALTILEESLNGLEAAMIKLNAEVVQHSGAANEAKSQDNPLKFKAEAQRAKDADDLLNLTDDYYKLQMLIERDLTAAQGYTQGFNLRHILAEESKDLLSAINDTLAMLKEAPASPEEATAMAEAVLFISRESTRLQDAYQVIEQHAAAQPDGPQSSFLELLKDFSNSKQDFTKKEVREHALKELEGYQAHLQYSHDRWKDQAEGQQTLREEDFRKEENSNISATLKDAMVALIKATEREMALAEQVAALYAGDGSPQQEGTSKQTYLEHLQAYADARTMHLVSLAKADGYATPEALAANNKTLVDYEHTVAAQPSSSEHQGSSMGSDRWRFEGFRMSDPDKPVEISNRPYRGDGNAGKVRGSGGSKSQGAGSQDSSEPVRLKPYPYKYEGPTGDAKEIINDAWEDLNKNATPAQKRVYALHEEEIKESVEKFAGKEDPRLTWDRMRAAASSSTMLNMERGEAQKALHTRHHHYCRVYTDHHVKDAAKYTSSEKKPMSAFIKGEDELKPGMIIHAPGHYAMVVGTFKEEDGTTMVIHDNGNNVGGKVIRRVTPLDNMRTSPNRHGHSRPFTHVSDPLAIKNEKILEQEAREAQKLLKAAEQQNENTPPQSVQPQETRTQGKPASGRTIVQ